MAKLCKNPYDIIDCHWCSFLARKINASKSKNITILQPICEVDKVRPIVVKA